VKEQGTSEVLAALTVTLKVRGQKFRQRLTIGVSDILPSSILQLDRTLKKWAAVVFSYTVFNIVLDILCKSKMFARIRVVGKGGAECLHQE
jgi:hypothetical protein